MPAETPAVDADGFDRERLSIDDPDSIWVISNKLRPLNPIDSLPGDGRSQLEIGRPDENQTSSARSTRCRSAGAILPAETGSTRSTSRQSRAAPRGASQIARILVRSASSRPGSSGSP